jgi:hypothetical protein
MLVRTNTNQNYVIPKIETKGGGRAFLMLPISMLFVGLLGYVRNGEAGLSSGLGTGFPVGVVLTIAVGWVSIARAVKRLKSIWDRHTFQWYRETSPEHAHANGHVSCRHCGSHKTNARNLMNQTFMRAHSCSQCGETLYFSKEL